MTGDPLLFLDLETTGTDETKDSIIEIGAILTTADLVDLGEFEMTVSPTDEALGRLMRNDVVCEMHRASGLLALTLGGYAEGAPHVAARQLMEWMERHLGSFPERPGVVLAGSGVGHFDRRFLDRYMPQVTHMLRHWVIDVGVVRRAYAMWTDTVEVHPQHVPGKTHRALDDARFHLAEARAWRRYFTDAEDLFGEHT